MLRQPHSKCAIVVLLLFCCCSCSREPTDEQLQARFAQHRRDFELLARMSEEDFASRQVIRIAPTFTRVVTNWGWPRPEAEWGITSQRWDEYRRLFGRVGLRDGLSRDGAEYGQIMFPFWAFGLVTGAKDRGVLYAPAEVHPIHSDRQTFDVRHIEGPWYVYTWVTG